MFFGCDILKLLIIVNNHNSIGIVDFCASLRKHAREIEITAVCGSDVRVSDREAIKTKGIALQVLHLDNIECKGNRQYSVVEGAVALEKKSVSNLEDGRTNPITKIISRIVNVVFSSSLAYFFRERRICHKLEKYKEKALKLLNDLKPDVVLSISDRTHDYIESSILWAANNCGVKVLLPYIAQYDKDAALHYRKTQDGKPLPELRPFWPFSVYKAISYTVLKERCYQGLFFQAPYVLNAHRKSGTLSAYPWWIGNGNSDVVCVDSEHTARKYEENRVKRQKIVIAGHVSYDDVYRSHVESDAISRKLVRKYSLDKKKKLVLLSMPQYAEQGYVGWERHWEEIDSIVRNASASDGNLLLSIHPRSNVSDYLFLEDEYHCRIVDEPLSKIIGAADLFLASNSTTFHWAVLCGIPSIALRSPVQFLFSHLESICPVDSSADLRSAINRILRSPPISFERDWMLLSRDRVFDGRFSERFIELIRVTCNNLA